MLTPTARIRRALRSTASNTSLSAMLQRLAKNIASIGGLLGSEVCSLELVRHMSGLVRGGGLRGAEWWLRAAVTSGRAYMRRDFLGHEVDHLYAPWLLHAGLSPDHAAGGFMTPLFAGTLHGFGLPVVAGGAGRFVAAFRSLLGSLGVRVETGFEVDRILVAQRWTGSHGTPRISRQNSRDRRPDAGRSVRPQPQRRQRRSVRRLRRAGPEFSMAASRLIGPPRDPGRPALAHRRLNPPRERVLAAAPDISSRLR